MDIQPLQEELKRNVTFVIGHSVQIKNISNIWQNVKGRNAKKI